MNASALFDEIPTRRMRLIPADLNHLDLLMAGPEVFTTATGLQIAPGYLEFPEALPHSRDQLAAAAAAPAWWTPWLFVHTASGTVIGLGGFKGPPAPNGTLEVGYGIAPEWRGQGYATEATLGLIGFGLGQPGVKAICAHTLAETNASTRVLAKCGLVRVAEITDPADGVIWRWELPARPPAG